VSTFFFLDSMRDQLAKGFFVLIDFAGLMPFLAGFLARMTIRVNVWLLGSLYGWQETGIAVTKIFFAVTCAFFAAYGAILLALAAAVSAGLIKSPWE
jgi:hypothetical protein